MDGSPLSHKVAHGRPTVIQGQGHFPKHWFTVGDTACSVNGVLGSLLAQCVLCFSSIRSALYV